MNARMKLMGFRVKNHCADCFLSFSI